METALGRTFPLCFEVEWDGRRKQRALQQTRAARLRLAALDRVTSEH